jgi:hypothetical protein
MWADGKKRSALGGSSYNGMDPSARKKPVQDFKSGNS